MLARLFKIVTVHGLKLSRRSYDAYIASGFRTNPHPLFDAQWYIGRYLGGRAGVDPLDHYLTYCADATIDPSPYFSTRFYRDTYLDARDFPRSPLEHYLDVGRALNRKPNLLFDPVHYRAAYRDIGADVRCCLTHYIEHGHKEGRKPHPLFDGTWYVAKNKDLQGSGIEPLRHFLQFGLHEGRSPHPLVDLDYVAGQVDDASRGPAEILARLVDPAHAEDCDPHPAFQVAHYRAATRGADAAANALLHYVTTAFAYGQPNEVFDSEWYVRTYPDVDPVRQNPLAHFLTYGYREGRNPSERFDTLWYVRSYPDADRSGLDPVSHYIRHGKAEGRLPLSTERGSGHGSDDIKAITTTIAQIKQASFLATPARVAYPATDQPVVSIILVLYNKSYLTLDCLRSILANTDLAACPYEVVILDNDSRDATSDVLDRVDNATIIRSGSNIGFLRAVNLAARSARGDYVLLLNNDTQVLPGSIEAAVRVFAEEADVGAVGAKLILPTGRLQEAGSVVWNDGSCLGYLRDQDPECFEANFRRDVDYCSGAFLLIRRSVFEELGGLDEIYVPAYYEETDLCARLAERGLKVVYDPFVQLLHFEFGSSASRRDAILLQETNRKTFSTRHAGFLRGKQVPDIGAVLSARFATRKAANILVIDDKVPHTALGSGFPRARHIINGLAEADVRVTVLPTDDAAQDWSAVRKTLAPSIEVAFGFNRPGLGDFLRAREEYYDLIVVSRPHNMEALNALIDAKPDLIGRATICYDAEALFSLREIAQRAIEGHPVPPDEQRSLVAREVEIARHADRVVCVSDREAAVYRQHGKDTVRIGHLLAAKPGSRTFAERQDLLFVGGFLGETTPNTDSIVWFIDHVFPLMRREIPDAKLMLVGECRSDQIRSRLSEAIVSLGVVDDLKDCYDSARIFVAPTRFAAGIPHKVHEAAAAGLPVVATTLLADQLAWSDRVELLAADEAEAFAAACVTLYRDSATWEALRGHALAAIERDCSQDAFDQGLREILGTVLKPRR